MTPLYRIAMFLLPVSEGSKNTNTIFHVVYKPGSATSRAVLFQEKVEAAYKRLLVFPLAVGLAIGAFLLTGEWFVAVIAALLASFVTIIPPIRRGVEYRGQSVETAIRVLKLGESYDAAEAANARQLTNYPQFKGWSAEKIAVELRKWRGWAQRMAKAFGEI